MDIKLPNQQQKQKFKISTDHKTSHKNTLVDEAWDNFIMAWLIKPTMLIDQELDLISLCNTPNPLWTRTRLVILQYTRTSHLIYQQGELQAQVLNPYWCQKMTPKLGNLMHIQKTRVENQTSKQETHAICIHSQPAKWCER